MHQTITVGHLTVTIALSVVKLLQYQLRRHQRLVVKVAPVHIQLRPQVPHLPCLTVSVNLCKVKDLLQLWSMRVPLMADLDHLLRSQSVLLGVDASNRLALGTFPVGLLVIQGLED